uniref:OSJNBa0061A09.6 protein n=1 Tax=Oryza sativa subsp. japonica TaxID=39947 RepID=Q7FA18_ORYSJ|nr:OSJNBa0061A09.6 [Oryza sativa Japonica Group]
MPIADQSIDAASGHKIISFMDGNAGYNQIFMTEEDIHKTAFRCPGAIGLYEWVVMTFGLKSARATYQRAMNHILHDLIGLLVEVYIDDVVVKSKEVDEHIANLRKLRHYLLSNECTIVCNADVIKYMLSAPVLKGRVGKWIYALTEFDLGYESPKAVKGQAIADRQGAPKVVEHRDDSIGSVEIVPWTLFFDGSLAGEYDCKNDVLMVYNEKCRELMDSFRLVTLKHVPREQNVEAHDLAQGASGYMPMVKDIEVEVAMVTADDWRYDVYQYLQNPSRSASRKLRYKALKYTLLDDELYYRTIDGVFLKCLSVDQAKVVMGEVHEGIDGTHQSAHKMKWLLRSTGYFWPTMLEDCFRYYKGCQDYQKFGAIQIAQVSATNPIIKPWPFRGWGIDMIGQINPPSSKENKFILVGTNYFTKWVEAVPLKKVDSGDAIQFVKEYIIYRFGVP